ncbi:hypothetical protein LSTR_LSTR002160 [Laodelphax striatellus]|uniref:THAP-type domain-containing protein n=1 Tax=Laodelphax striatellus TaxID=195883 RepID=A0A482XQZ7_LAOST|nr:hypothetical protein LSTR_LSTR002160 [Laodelphax striatellus]
MVKYCAARNCNNKFYKGSNIHFYKFPLRKPTLLKKWLKELGRRNFMPSAHHFLCSDHFKPECFLANTVNKKSLTDDAVPTIFSNYIGKLLAIKMDTDEPCQTTRTTTMVTRRMSRKETSRSPKPGGSRSADFLTESELDKYFNGQFESESESVNEESNQIYDDPYTQPKTPYKVKREATPTALIFSESESSDSQGIENNKYHDPYTRTSTRSMKKNRLRVKRTKNKGILTELVSLKRKFKRQFNKKHVKMFISLSELINLLKQKSLISEEAASIISESFQDLSLEIFRTVSPNAKFSDVLESFASTLYFYSPAAYRYVLKSLKLCLPTVTKLRNIYKSVEGKPGFTSEAFQAIKHRARNANYPIYVALLFDEMTVEKHFEWDGDCFFGAVNMGKGVEPGIDTEAREAFVIMAVAINACWKIPIAYFLIDSLAPDIKANLINESIVRLHEAGVQVKSVTSAPLQTNMTIYTKLGASNNKMDPDPAFDNPVTNKKVFTLFDTCYMMKTMRHILCSNKVLIDKDGSCIKWLYIERLQRLQEKKMFLLANKLKKIRVNYCGQKMKDKLAPHLLSASVGEALLFLANDLKHPGFEGAEATANFCFVLDKLFDLCNSKNRFAKGYKAALSESNKFKWLPFLNEAENYLTNLADSNGLPLMSSGKTTILGLVWTIRGMRRLFHDLVESKELKYLITYKFSHDHLEMFFWMIRSLSGREYNPTAFKFKDAYKKLLIQDKVENDNTGERNELVDVPLLSLEQENHFRDLGVEMDPSIFSTACRDGNCDFEDLATVIDDDYIALPTNLSEYSSNVVFYLAGFVARRISSKVNCETCSDALIEQEITNHSHVDFFARENNGVLVVPSKDVVTICNLLEHEIRVRQLTSDERCPNNISPLEIWKNVMETVKDLHIFVKLSDHFLDNIFPENHLIRLVILISKMYVKLRCHNGRSSSLESMVIHSYSASF